MLRTVGSLNKILYLKCIAYSWKMQSKNDFQLRDNVPQLYIIDVIF